jgi:hypothetical protein
MTTEMQARIMFDNREDMKWGWDKLTKLGFRVEILNLVDTDPEGGPYVWVRAYISVDYDDGGRFFEWVRGLGVGGDVIEGGLCHPV